MRVPIVYGEERFGGLSGVGQIGAMTGPEAFGAKSYRDWLNLSAAAMNHGRTVIDYAHNKELVTRQALGKHYGS